MFFLKSFNYGEETEVTRGKNLDYPRMFLYYPSKSIKNFYVDL